jgi:uncharacterized membrane protein
MGAILINVGAILINVGAILQWRFDQLPFIKKD